MDRTDKIAFTQMYLGSIVGCIGLYYKWWDISPGKIGIVLIYGIFLLSIPSFYILYYNRRKQ